MSSASKRGWYFFFQITTPLTCTSCSDLTPKMPNEFPSCHIFRKKARKEVTEIVNGQMFLISRLPSWPLRILLARLLWGHSPSSVRHLLTARTLSFLFFYLQRAGWEELSSLSNLCNKRPFLPTFRFPSAKEVELAQAEVITGPNLTLSFGALGVLFSILENYTYYSIYSSHLWLEML